MTHSKASFSSAQIKRLIKAAGGGEGIAITHQVCRVVQTGMRDARRCRRIAHVPVP